MEKDPNGSKLLRNTKICFSLNKESQNSSHNPLVPKLHPTLPITAIWLMTWRAQRESAAGSAPPAARVAAARAFFARAIAAATRAATARAVAKGRRYEICHRTATSATASSSKGITNYCKTVAQPIVKGELCKVYSEYKYTMLWQPRG